MEVTFVTVVDQIAGVDVLVHERAVKNRDSRMRRVLARKFHTRSEGRARFLLKLLV